MTHCFYYAIVQTLGNSQAQIDRVNRIQNAALQHGLSCHQETLGDVITLQIETQDDEVAIVFKLAAEIALYESHS